MLLSIQTAFPTSSGNFPVQNLYIIHAACSVDPTEMLHDTSPVCVCTMVCQTTVLPVHVCISLCVCVCYNMCTCTQAPIYRGLYKNDLLYLCELCVNTVPILNCMLCLYEPTSCRYVSDCALDDPPCPLP